MGYKRLIIVILIAFIAFIPCYSQHNTKIPVLKTSRQLLDSLTIQKNYDLGRINLPVNPDSSLLCINKGFELSQKYQSKKFIAMGNSMYGRFYIMNNDPLKAREFILQACRLYFELKDIERLGINLTLLAVTYSSDGNYEEAIRYRYYSIQCLERGKDLLSLSVAYSSLSFDYMKLNKMKNALEMMKHSVVIKEQFKDTLSLVLGYANLAGIYQELEEFANAEIYLQKALNLAEMKNISFFLPTIYYGLYTALSEQGRKNEAHPYLQYNIDHFETLSMPIKMYTLVAKGNGYIKDGNFIMAASDFEKALEIAQQIHDPAYARICHDQLYIIYSSPKMKNDSKALIHYRAMMEIDEANRVQEALVLAEDLKVKYETGKKEQAILLLENRNELLDKQSENRKLWILILAVSVTLILIISILVFLLFRSRQRTQKKIKELEIIKTKAEFEQKILGAQMNPHFIFNSLNSIQYFILSKQTEEAYDYLSRFSKLIRQVLNNSELNTIELKKEIELLELYIQLEQIRFDNCFSYQIVYDEHTDVNEITLPVMLVQPFVENAIWHGMMNLPADKKGELYVLFTAQNDNLKIIIKDNGIGRKASESLKTNSEHQSVGVLFSQKRLEILQTVYKKEAKIIIIDLYDQEGKAEGTQVEIILPI